mgnify:CR=1 FL=1
MVKDFVAVTLVSFVVFTFLDWLQPGLISLYINPVVLLLLLFVATLAQMWYSKS